MKPKYIIPAKVDKLLTTKEVGEIFGVTDRQVRNWIFKKDIPYSRSGRGSGYKIPFYAVIGLAVSKLLKLKKVPKFWELVRLVEENSDFLSKHIFILYRDGLVPLSPSILLNEEYEAFVFEAVIPAMKFYITFYEDPFPALSKSSKKSKPKKKPKRKRIPSKEL